MARKILHNGIKLVFDSPNFKLTYLTTTDINENDNALHKKRALEIEYSKTSSRINTVTQMKVIIENIYQSRGL
ncbi:hypothetical protein ACJX0J_005678, partial [Zea mays]